MDQVNQFILYVSSSIPFRSGLDRHLIRAAMVFTFFAFSIQKWSQYTSEMLVPLISHSPVVFWSLPAFGVRGAGYFLGTSVLLHFSLYGTELATQERLAASIVHAVSQPITPVFAAIDGDSLHPTNPGGADVTDGSCYFG